MSAVLLTLFFGTAAVAVAAPLLADDCCERDAHGCPKDGCACPQGCDACTAPAAIRAIPADLSSEVPPAALWEILDIAEQVQRPPSRAPAEILHVPKG